MEVSLTQEGKDFVGDHWIYTTDLTHHFNADEYREHGFQTAISPTERGYTISKKSNKVLNKFISKTEVNYFDCFWLDTSAISLMDFSTKFTNYQVEKE